MLFLQDAISGVSAGLVYGLLALALVIVYRATGVINFAAGEMATFSTFLAWEFIDHFGLPFFVTLSIVSVISAAVGIATYAIVIHPGRHKPEFVTVMLTFGLFQIFNGLSQTLWSPTPRTFPAPLDGPPLHVGPIDISRQSIGVAVVALGAMALIAALFRFTKIGLGLRATTDNPFAARAVGIQPARMYALGWGLASVAGAIAGMLVANVLLLSPSMMGNVLIFSLVAVIVGGLESPVGAIVGGLLIGVIGGVLAGTPGVGPNLSTPLMLLLVIVVLLVRPQGLFGEAKARKL